MNQTDSGRISCLAFDLFGTTFDWWTGIRDQISELAARRGVEVDADAFTRQWRQQFFVGLERVRSGRRDWANLDTVHAEGLVQVLADLELSEVFKDNHQELIRAWHRLPVWADVPRGLERLRAGFTACGLSNGGFAQITNLVKNAGLRFDCLLGADVSRCYKPDIEIYLSAAELLDLPPREIMMVAAHGWDLDGARAAGFRTAYVARPLEHGPHQAAEEPTSVECDLLVSSFDELADALGCP
jgi:2-haloacid dehalogenase